MILNTSCDSELVPDRLKPLYAYINDPNKVEDEFVEQIQEEVSKFNSGEWRRVQVTLKELMDRQKEEGEARGEARVNKLNARLLEEGKIEELRRATQDEDFQNELFKEYGI